MKIRRVKVAQATLRTKKCSTSRAAFHIYAATLTVSIVWQCSLCSASIARCVLPMQSDCPCRMRLTVACDAPIALAILGSDQLVAALTSRRSVEICLSMNRSIYVNG